jgi:hypothetical protein
MYFQLCGVDLKNKTTIMTIKLFAFSLLLVPFWFFERNTVPEDVYTLPEINQSNKERIARAMVINMSNQNFEDARTDFSDSLKLRMKPGMLEGPWMAVINNAGAFKAILSAEEQNVEGIAQVVVFCQFENANAVVQVMFNDDEKVSALYLKPVGR